MAILLSILYLLGFILSYSMQRVEIAAEGHDYTKGDRVLNVLLSLLSFLWVLVLLVVTWISKIRKLGYWSKPVKPAK